MRRRFRMTADLHLPAEHPDAIFEPPSMLTRVNTSCGSGAVATMGAAACASCSRAHRLKHHIVRGGIDRHVPGRNTSDMTDTAGSSAASQMWDPHWCPACCVKAFCRPNGRSDRPESPFGRRPHRVTFRLAKLHFAPPGPMTVRAAGQLSPATTEVRRMKAVKRQPMGVKKVSTTGPAPAIWV